MTARLTSEGPPLPSIAFLGIDFALLDLNGALAYVRQAARGETFRYVVTPNVDHVVRLHKRGEDGVVREFAAAVRGADLCVNDSRILARLARLSGASLPVAPGSDLTRRLVDEGVQRGDRIALIGGQEREAQWLRAALPEASIVHHQPPMGVLKDPVAQAAIVSFIEQACAEYVLLCIGAPQSEIVAHQVSRRGVARGVGLCVGASIEFLSGAKRRAPPIVQRLGLEWAHRLLSEPARMWRRYLVEGPRIFAIWWHTRR